jgi:hypothetical protein
MPHEERRLILAACSLQLASLFYGFRKMGYFQWSKKSVLAIQTTEN